MNTVVKNEQYNYVLKKNGIESVCPYQQRLVIPNQNSFGTMQMQIVSFPCCTVCPHADFDLKFYSINCSGNEKIIDIDKIENETPVMNLINP